MAAPTPELTDAPEAPPAEPPPWDHDHSFGQEEPKAGEARTLVVVAITFATMVVEIVAGVAFGSMALLADGLHMGSHGVALGIAAFAYVYARRHAHDPRFSFGTGKVNALAGFTGGVLLVGFALYMVVESVDRFLHPVAIVFDRAIAVAVIGLVVNGVCAWILGTAHDHDHGHGHGHEHGHGHHHDHDHNLRSAYLHVLADALTSLLAIGALLAGKLFGAVWMDPAMGLVGAALVTRWSWGLLRATSDVLLDRQAPEPVRRAIVERLEAAGDARVADLHVWSIGPGLLAAEIGIVSARPATAVDYKARLADVRHLAHVTVEVHADGSASASGVIRE